MGCQTPLSEAAVPPHTHAIVGTLWRGPKLNPDLEPQQMKKGPLSSSWSRPIAEVAKILILVWFCLANKEHAKQLLHACARVYVCVCVPSTHPHTSPDLGGAGRGRLRRDQELIPGLAVWLWASPFPLWASHLHGQEEEGSRGFPRLCWLWCAGCSRPRSGASRS